MLTQVCQYLRNFFDRRSDGSRLPAWTEEITITGGELAGFADRLLPGQYFRILDSVMNDGVHQYGVDTLTDETFYGTVQSMAVPQAVVDAAEALKEYRSKYGEALDSPFASENYFGYSWTKGAAATAETSGMPASVAATLNQWRKI